MGNGSKELYKEFGIWEGPWKWIGLQKTNNSQRLLEKENSTTKEETEKHGLYLECV